MAHIDLSLFLFAKSMTDKSIYGKPLIRHKPIYVTSTWQLNVVLEMHLHNHQRMSLENINMNFKLNSNFDDIKSKFSN